MNRSRTFGAGVVAGVTLAGALWLGVQALSGAVRAPDQAEGPKNTTRVVLENDRVRVKDNMYFPSDTNPGMHTHDLPHVGVIIQGGTLLFRSLDGETETLTFDAGEVGYREADVTHEPINTGHEPVRVIEVELK